MDDEQIVMTHRAFDYAAAVETDVDGADVDGYCYNLQASFQMDLVDLAAIDPDRVRSLVVRCGASAVCADFPLVYKLAPALVDFDYSFALDAMIGVYLASCDLENGWGWKTDLISEGIWEEVGNWASESPQRREEFNRIIVEKVGRDFIVD